MTPEYNHSVSAALKNAIDYLPPATLKEKAVGLVGYSWYGAVKPLEHLREIMSTFGADVRDQQVGINLGSDFQDGVFTPPRSSASRSVNFLRRWRENRF